MLECHQIDTTAGQAAIAFRGATPWHGLGQEIAAGDSLEAIQKKAGLAFEVLRAPAEFTTLDAMTGTAVRHAVPRTEVLFRSDTKRSLGVVSRGYQVHQPTEIVGFFRDLVEAAGFEIEVAGALREGRKIWALARVNREACVAGDDLIRAFVLLSTTFDGSAATRGQYTDVRVVCNNTMRAAESDGRGRVSIMHSTKFDANKIRDRLGLVAGTFDSRLNAYRALSATSLTTAKVDSYLVDLFANVSKVVPEDGQKVEDAVRQSKGYKQVLALFDGAGKGSTMPGVSGTAWGLLNAVTEFVDHHAGRGTDTRLDSAWFGKGAQIKDSAFDKALALV